MKAIVMALTSEVVVAEVYFEEGKVRVDAINEQLKDELLKIYKTDYETLMGDGVDTSSYLRMFYAGDEEHFKVVTLEIWVCTRGKYKGRIVETGSCPET